jgi:hypothetical protein
MIILLTICDVVISAIANIQCFWRMISTKVIEEVLRE